MKNALRAAVRSIYRRLLPPGAKNSLHAWTLFDKPDAPPGLIDSFPEQRVMVLAPHMDDEVVGCGGVLRLHALGGARISVIFLTDGGASDPRLADSRQSDDRLRDERAVLCARRKREAAEAAKILGYEDQVFLDRPDGRLAVDDDLVREVAELVSRFDPEIIYYPCALELHPDHWQASRLLAKLPQAGDYAISGQTRCRGYEAWTPLLPNKVADISDVLEAKLEALKVFESQLEHVDYVHTTVGLNAYRSVNQGGRGHCEAFYECSAAEHAELVRQLESARRSNS
jgi:LmbE family N-acetylglucosaminyl deacetylase